MVKKKKNRHQQEPPADNRGDSTESCDENQANNSSSGKCCSHVAKSVDISRVKKALRGGGIVRECAECVKTLPSVNSSAQEEADLWLCLKCGNQACGRSRKEHALKHHQTPRSEPHVLAVDTEHWNIWCYDCGCEVSAQCQKKLHECVEFIKRQDGCKKVLQNAAVESNTDKTAAPLKESRIMALTNVLPRVRGLCNVGNTCFFNAVLQCLAQTPFLLPVLQEMSESGAKFQLVAEDLPLLEGELGKWGNLTEMLASTLIELQSSKCEVFNPSRLLNKLIQRCPQFGGGEQHDSHELLRHLLEGVRTEDLKRYQSAILHLFGLSEKSNPTQVEDEVRTKARAYGRQASEMMLHPEQVFRGFLVSTLECQDCLHSSQCVESFLDLSLPVMADKPQPPVVRRKTANDESFDLCGNSSEGQPSKHQLKKERKQARKDRKRQKGRIVTTKNSGESEHSDADVEDNVEQDAGSKSNGIDVGESGYSSEKLGNEDSVLESPVSRIVDRDSALASPADVEDSASPSHKDVSCQHTLSPVCNGIVSAATVPSSPLISPRETPSPVSSEVNIDCSSSVSTHVHGDCASPDSNRPISRFEFCNDEATRCSPVEDDCTKTLCEEMSRLSVDYSTNTCTKFVLVTQPAINGWEEVDNGCKDVDSGCKEMDNGCKDVDSGCKEVDSGCKDVDSGCKDLDIGCKDVDSGCKDVDSGCKDMDNDYKKDMDNGCKDWNVTVAPRYQCEEGECSVQSCLNQFTALELMTGNNKVSCENCTQRQNQGKEGKMVCTNSTKQLLVKSPPAVLILHLKRFQVHRTTFRKLSRHVSFPLVLDMAPICSATYKELLMMKPGQTQMLYALYGVVEHSGTLYGGHYVAYVKVRAPVDRDDPRWLFLQPDPQAPRREAVNGKKLSAEAPSGKWYFVSDSRVSEVGEERVLRSQAYLLFYERIC